MNFPPGITRIILKDGTIAYRVRIRIKGHKPVSQNFKNLTHAKRWKRVTEAKIEQGLYVSFSEAEKHTLSRAIDRYLREVLPSKPNDKPNVERHLNRWAKELGHLKLNRLTPSMIAEIRDKLLGEEIRTGKKRSNATVKRYLSSFSHLLSTAVKEWEWMHENPCLKVKKPKEGPPRVRYLSDDELNRLLKACKESRNQYLYLIALIVLTTGIRKSEAINLKWTDIDFDHHLLHIRNTKNGQDRSVSMCDQVYALLKKHPRTTSLLFPSPNNPSEPIYIRSAWEAAVKRASIENFKFHDTRHTCASYLAMEGSGIGEIAEILGHKSLQMTKRYAHLSHEYKRKAINKIGNKIDAAVD